MKTSDDLVCVVDVHQSRHHRARHLVLRIGVRGSFLTRCLLTTDFQMSVVICIFVLDLNIVDVKNASDAVDHETNEIFQIASEGQLTKVEPSCLGRVGVRFAAS